PAPPRQRHPQRARDLHHAPHREPRRVPRALRSATLLALMGIEHRLHARCAGFHGGHEGHEHAAARPFAFATSQRHFERPGPFAITPVGLDLALDFATRSVSGSATLLLRRVDPEATSVELDAIGFTISAVTVDGVSAAYVYDGARFVVDIAARAERASLVVS